ncbi:MAG: hypothetical protein GY760_12060 [Deltaproteobacteria bacterium]|nr:hypothetical protein [Deltaproteobacteria bacterium]
MFISNKLKFKKNKKRFVSGMVVVLIFLIISSAPVYAQTVPSQKSVPSLINYQGMLTDSDGKPLTGNKTIEFNLYDSATSTTPVWGPQEFENVSVVNGRFNVILGEKDIIGRSLIGAFGSGKRFIAIKVDDKEILPRQQILSTPFAVQSENAQNSQNAKNAENSINSQNADLTKAVVIPPKPIKSNTGYKLVWNEDGTAKWEMSWYETDWFQAIRNKKYEFTNNFNSTKVNIEVWWNSSTSDEGMRYVTGQFYSVGAMGAYKRVSSDKLVVGSGNGYTYYSNYTGDPVHSYAGFYKLVVRKN